MMASTDRISIRMLGDLTEFERCVELQVAVWGYSGGDVIPRRMFLLAQRIGGQVLGGFDGETMVAFAMALPGYREGRPYLHSHMLAVLPEYRNLGVGQRLKLAQREDALARGFELMEWTFDPLEIKNAYLNVAKLGAICRRYQADFYGPSSSPLQGGLPTDRLYAEWWLGSARVEACLKGELPVEEVEEQVLVPHEIQEWKQDAEKRGLAQTLQQYNREALEAAFGRGLAVVGYRRETNGDGCYLLGRVGPGVAGWKDRGRLF